jgi:hypothetical protein
MKIQVVRCDGSAEVINLVGVITASESSMLHVEATGADYFFREDGHYDGWGMAVGSESGMSADEASALIQAVEADREIIKPSDMSSEELEAVVQGLDDVQHGRTKSLLQIDAEIELS